MIVIARPLFQALETEKLFLAQKFNNIYVFPTVDIIVDASAVEKFVEIYKTNQCDALIFTSQNALYALSQSENILDYALCSLPVFVVGKKTAQKACQMGFPHVIKSPTDNAEGILPLLEKHQCSRPLFGAGRDRKETISKSDALDVLYICTLYSAEENQNITALPFKDHKRVDILCFSMRMFNITQKIIEKQNTMNAEIIWHIVGQEKLYNEHKRFIFYNSPDALYDAFNLK